MCPDPGTGHLTGPATVADAMLATPVLSGALDTTGDVRRLLAGGHRHAALLVDERGVLLAVVTRDDLDGDAAEGAPARDLGRLDGRTVGVRADLATTRAAMLADRRRRLAVVDDAGHLLGLLCLKRHGRDFCSAEDLAERTAASSEM